MKKLLGILVLGLLWCNVGVAADCQDDIDFSWKYSSKNPAILHTGKLTSQARYMTFYKNPTKNKHLIVKVDLVNDDKEIVFTQKIDEIIKPYHSTYFHFQTPSGFMDEIVAFATMSCREK